MDSIQVELQLIFEKYQKSFSKKIYADENEESDLLMEVFGVTQELKRENKQYWGRELGMCWQLIVSKIAELNCGDYQPPVRVEGDEPTDFFIGTDAIDTKYRMGSGDSGTLKKFKKYGDLLKQQGYTPILLVLRTDNLPAAITACKTGGWDIYMGKDCLNYIKSKTGFDIEMLLHSLKGKFDIQRSR